MEKIQILVVEDFEDWQSLWKMELEKAGMEVVVVGSASEALKVIREDGERFEGAIIDKGDIGESNSAVLGHHDGFRIAEKLRGENPYCRIVMATAEEYHDSVFNCRWINAFVDKNYPSVGEVVKYLQLGFLRINEGKNLQVFVEEGGRRKGVEKF